MTRPFPLSTALVLVTASHAVAIDFGPNRTLVDIVLHYYPSIPVSGVAAVIYMVAAAAIFTVLYRARDWWGLCLPIGAVFESVGYIIRIELKKYPNSMPIFILMQLFIVCSPAAFLAFNYILYSRFVRVCVGSEYSIIRPELVSKIFVTSDITTLVIQAAGSSMQFKTSLMNIGRNLFLGGIVLQAASYLIFCFLVLHTHWCIRKSGLKTGKEVWWKLLWVLYFSSICIVLRCVYRISEIAQGTPAHPGKLLTHEIYFYLLDTIPLLVAITVYVPFWPGKFFKDLSSETELS